MYKVIGFYKLSMPSKLMTAILAVLTLAYILGAKSYPSGFETISTFGQYRASLIFFTSYFVGIYISKRTQVNDKILAHICIVLILLSVAVYFQKLSVIIIDKGENATNNTSYRFVACIPFIPYLIKKNKILGLIAVFVTTSFIVASYKRGAMVCLVLAIIIYAFDYYKTHKINIKTILIGAVALVAIYAYVESKIEKNAYLQMRLEQTAEGYSSGRDIIYAQLFEHFREDDNILHLILGNGTAYTLKITERYAHNDWLEILTDNGILGVVLYLSIFISLYRYFNVKKTPTFNKLSANLILAMWFAQTLFSMGYTSMPNSIFMLLLGINIMEVRKYRQHIKTRKTHNNSIDVAERTFIPKRDSNNADGHNGSITFKLR